jgi:hypothetical protein
MRPLVSLVLAGINRLPVSNSSKETFTGSIPVSYYRFKVFQMLPGTSVADPVCLSQIPNPDFYPSRIPDPKSATKEMDEKKICCHTYLFL